MPRGDSRLCPVAAVLPWASGCTSLSLCPLVCNLGAPSVAETLRPGPGTWDSAGGVVGAAPVPHWGSAELVPREPGPSRS